MKKNHVNHNFILFILFYYHILVSIFVRHMLLFNYIILKFQFLNFLYCTPTHIIVITKDII